MKGFFASLLIVSGIFSTTLADAAPTVDFHASILNFDDGVTLDHPRLVADASFAGAGLTTLGTFTVYYTVVDTGDGLNTTYSGSLTITSGQTSVKSGSLATGKFVVSYDAATDTVTGRFTLQPAYSQYSIKMSGTAPGGWEGNATVSSAIIL